MKRRWAMMALAAGSIAASGACELVTKQPPVPDRVAVVGDSVTVLASYYGGGLGGWDDADKIGIGWQAEHAQPRLTADVQGPTTSPDILVVALGENDAARSYGRDGFTDEDRLQLWSLIGTPADGACVALVKPWYQPPEGQPVDQSQVDGIAAYRDWVDQVVQSDPERYRSVDWRPVVEADPMLLADDGVHIRIEDQTLSANELTVAVNDGETAAVEQPAAQAYLAVLHAAAYACGSGG
jgi:hypothetical protein